MTDLSWHQQKALEWFAARAAPIAWFDKDSPSITVRKKLEKLRLIEAILPPDDCGMIKYQISRLGREWLSTGGC